LEKPAKGRRRGLLEKEKRGDGGLFESYSREGGGKLLFSRTKGEEKKKKVESDW